MDKQINKKIDRITTLFIQELRSRLGSHLKEAILFGLKREEMMPLFLHLPVSCM
jgi:hypothetical protein